MTMTAIPDDLLRDIDSRLEAARVREGRPDDDQWQHDKPLLVLIVLEHMSRGGVLEPTGD